MTREQKIKILKTAVIVLSIIALVVISCCVTYFETRYKYQNTNNSFTATVNTNIAAMGSYSPTEHTLTVTATVMPVDAPNKKVDWSLDWNLNPPTDGTPVSDYVTLTPAPDGGNSCTLRAIKGFGDSSMKLTCTTRAGNFESICYIGYDGAPDKMVLKLGTNTIQPVTMAGFDAGTTQEFDVSFTNSLNSVGNKYLENKNVTITQIKGNGRFTAEKREIVNGTVTSKTDVTMNVDDYVDQFVSASMVNGKLKVVFKKSISNFIYPQAAVRTGTQYYYKDVFRDPRGGGAADPTFIGIYMKDSYSQKESVFWFKINSVITSLSLDTTYFEF